MAGRKGHRVGNLAAKVGGIDKRLKRWEGAYRDLAENLQAISQRHDLILRN